MTLDSAFGNVADLVFNLAQPNITLVGDQAAFSKDLPKRDSLEKKQRPLCNGASVLADSPASTDLPHLLRRQVGGAGTQLHLAARLWHCDGLHPYRHDRVLAHFKFLGDLGGYIHHATGNEWTATPMVQPVETARSHRPHTGCPASRAREP